MKVFVKSRRAQNEDDDETWIDGLVTPTLNAFDNSGESRATVLIIDGTRVGDIRVYEDEVMQTVIQRWGTGGGNVPAIFPIQNTTSEGNDVPVLMRGREGKDGGGKGPLLSDDMSLTLATSNDQVLFEDENKPISIVRRLTPVECERLQGFPDGWTEQRYDYKKRQIVDQADSNRYKQMGNAVAVPVVDWLVKRLIEAEANDE